MVIFDFDTAARIFPQLLWAFRINIAVTIAAFAIAATLGLALAILARSPNALVRRSIRGYIEFVRSTPLLAQLFFLFFVLPQFGIRLEAYTIGIVALGFHYATYTAEVYRAGFEAVPRAQWESGVALNFNRSEIWWRIILPQAIPPVVPMLGNYFISMIKDTPLLAAITVAEAMQLATVMGARTYQYLEPVTIVGINMLVASLALAYGVELLNARLNKRHGLARSTHH